MWALHGLYLPSGLIHLLWCGVLCDLWVDTCSTMNLHGLQEDSQPHHGLCHGLQGNLCCSAWNTSFPSCFADFGICRIVSLNVLAPCSWLLFHCRFGFFLPFSNVFSQRCYHHHCLSQPWPAACPSWTWLSLALMETGEASSSFSQKPPL